MGVFAAGRMTDICRSGFAPLPRRLFAVEVLELITIEEIEDGSARSAEAFKIPDCCRVDVDATDAAELALEVPYARVGFVETFSSTAQPADCLLYTSDAADE